PERPDLPGRGRGAVPARQPRGRSSSARHRPLRARDPRRADRRTHPRLPRAPLSHPRAAPRASGVPLPSSPRETVREDGWSGRDSGRIAHSPDSVWRNRTAFLRGRRDHRVPGLQTGARTRPLPDQETVVVHRRSQRRAPTATGIIGNDMTASRIPTLDIRRFTDPASAADRQAFVDELGAAYREWGFAGIRNHGIPQSLVDDAYGVFKAFFALPEQTKEQYHVPGGGGARGYTPFGVETAKGAAYFDLKEFWHIGREIPDDSKHRDVMPPNLWPAEVEGFRARGYA